MHPIHWQWTLGANTKRGSPGATSKKRPRVQGRKTDGWWAWGAWPVPPQNPTPPSIVGATDDGWCLNGAAAEGSVSLCGGRSFWWVMSSSIVASRRRRANISIHQEESGGKGEVAPLSKKNCSNDPWTLLDSQACSPCPTPWPPFAFTHTLLSWQQWPFTPLPRLLHLLSIKWTAAFFSYIPHPLAWVIRRHTFRFNSTQMQTATSHHTGVDRKINLKLEAKKKLLTPNDIWLLGIKMIHQSRINQWNAVQGCIMKHARGERYLICPSMDRCVAQGELLNRSRPPRTLWGCNDLCSHTDYSLALITADRSWYTSKPVLHCFLKNPHPQPTPP